MLFSANMCSYVFASHLNSLWTLYGVERYYAEWLLGIAPLYRVVFGIGILLGLVHYSQSMRDKWFCCAFKLCFVQLKCKASLIFKSNLELALLIILKERELYKSKHVMVECRCLKICNLLSFLICSSILVLKWRQVSPI